MTGGVLVGLTILDQPRLSEGAQPYLEQKHNLGWRVAGLGPRWRGNNIGLGKKQVPGFRSSGDWGEATYSSGGFAITEVF